MPAANGPTARLCRWADETGYQDIPEEVRQESVTLLYDQLGGMIASATLPSCRPVAGLAARLGGSGECSIVGLPLRTSVTNAALANGTIAHGDEVDSTGQQGTGHYAATTVPAAVAMAQHVGSSGQDFMRALTLGSEVAARFQSVLGHYGTRPEFVGSVGGTMGAAVSAGLLLGLNDDQMENALALAASGACGLSSHHQDDTHQIKSLNHGRAAEAAIVSALLAQDGFHGPREVMTTEHGFFDAFLGLPGAGNDVMTGLGDEYLMREVAYKRYPVGGPDQTPLYAFLQLMRANEFTADDIEQIEVSVSESAFHTVKTNHHPSVHMETVLTLAAVLRGHHLQPHPRPVLPAGPPLCGLPGPGPHPHHPPRRPGQPGRTPGNGHHRPHPGRRSRHPGPALPPDDRGRDKAEVPHPSRPQDQRRTGPRTGTKSAGS